MRHSLALALAALSLAGSACLAQPTPQEPTAEAQAPLTAVQARAVAESFASQLEASFVFPEVGERYAAALRAKAAAGGYDAVADRRAFAEALTADVQAIAPDGHLRVFAEPPRFGGGGGSAPHRVPRAIEEARTLAPGIGYIRFTMFPGDPEVTAAAAKFMADHVDASTLIIDIRTNGGGGLDQMDAIFPYLYAEPTVLVAMDTRLAVEQANGTPFEEGPTLRRAASPPTVVRREHLALPHASEKRLHDAKVYLLTSGRTGSAAEHFALSLKRTGRATLIGATTGGAGHYGGVQELGEGFAAFIPVGRTFDPDTGEGWEGVGVNPHVEVPAERALVEALKLAGIAADEAERLSASVHPSAPMLRP